MIVSFAYLLALFSFLVWISTRCLLTGIRCLLILTLWTSTLTIAPIKYTIWLVTLLYAIGLLTQSYYNDNIIITLTLIILLVFIPLCQ